MGKLHFKPYFCVHEKKKEGEVLHKKGRFGRGRLEEKE